MRTFEFPALLINHIIDEGAVESIETVKTKTQSKELFGYLAEKYGEKQLDGFAVQGEVEDYLIDFFGAFDEGDFFRKFLVKKNGLNLLLAALITSK